MYESTDSMESPPTFKRGDIVWVKLSGCWWPGEVKSPEDLPTELVTDFRKPPLVIVKFFEEDSYEYVKSWSGIYPYNCDKKNDFIKRGMAGYRSKLSHMATFPKDIGLAEEKTNGNPNILSDPEFLPPKKINYDEIFGTPSPKKKPGKLTPIKKVPSKEVNKGHITHRRFIGNDDYKAFVLIQYPEKDRKYESDEEDLKKLDEEPQRQLTCHSCPFKTKRLEVMILHTRMHLLGVPLGPKRKVNKKPIESSLSDSETDTSKPPAPKQKKKPATPKKKDIFSDLLNEWEESDEEIGESSQKIAIKKKQETETPKPAEPKQRKKNASPKKKDIFSDLVNEWEETDEENEDSPKKVVKTKKKQTKSQNPPVLSEENLDNTASPTKTLDSLNSPPASDAKVTQDDIRNCFDFDEDEDGDIVLPASGGRKIPRMIPEKPKPSIEELLEESRNEERVIEKKKKSSVSNKSDNVSDSEDIPNKEEILKTSESFQRCVELNENIDNAFKELMEETAIPNVDDIASSLKPEQNFHDVRTIKFPDKGGTSTPDTGGTGSSSSTHSSGAKKKRFVTLFEDFEAGFKKRDVGERRSSYSELQKRTSKKKDVASTPGEKEISSSPSEKSTEPIIDTHKIKKSSLSEENSKNYLLLKNVPHDSGSLDSTSKDEILQDQTVESKPSHIERKSTRRKGKQDKTLLSEDKEDVLKVLQGSPLHDTELNISETQITEQGTSRKTRRHTKQFIVEEDSEEIIDISTRDADNSVGSSDQMSDELAAIEAEINAIKASLDTKNEQPELIEESDSRKSRHIDLEENEEVIIESASQEIHISKSLPDLPENLEKNEDKNKKKSHKAEIKEFRETKNRRSSRSQKGSKQDPQNLTTQESSLVKGELELTNDEIVDAVADHSKTEDTIVSLKNKKSSRLRKFSKGESPLNTSEKIREQDKYEQSVQESDVQVAQSLDLLTAKAEEIFQNQIDDKIKDQSQNQIGESSKPKRSSRTRKTSKGEMHIDSSAKPSTSKSDTDLMKVEFDECKQSVETSRVKDAQGLDMLTPKAEETPAKAKKNRRLKKISKGDLESVNYTETLESEGTLPSHEDMSSESLKETVKDFEEKQREATSKPKRSSRSQTQLKENSKLDEANYSINSTIVKSQDALSPDKLEESNSIAVLKKTRSGRFKKYSKTESHTSLSENIIKDSEVVLADSVESEVQTPEEQLLIRRSKRHLREDKELTVEREDRELGVTCDNVKETSSVNVCIKANEFPAKGKKTKDLQEVPIKESEIISVKDSTSNRRQSKRHKQEQDTDDHINEIPVADELKQINKQVPTTEESVGQSSAVQFDHITNQCENKTIQTKPIQKLEKSVKEPTFKDKKSRSKKHKESEKETNDFHHETKIALIGETKKTIEQVPDEIIDANHDKTMAEDLYNKEIELIKVNEEVRQEADNLGHEKTRSFLENSDKPKDIDNNMHMDQEEVTAVDVFSKGKRGKSKRYRKTSDNLTEFGSKIGEATQPYEETSLSEELIKKPADLQIYQTNKNTDSEIKPLQDVDNETALISKETDIKVVQNLQIDTTQQLEEQSVHEPTSKDKNESNKYTDDLQKQEHKNAEMEKSGDICANIQVNTTKSETSQGKRYNSRRHKRRSESAESVTVQAVHMKPIEELNFKESDKRSHLKENEISVVGGLRELDKQVSETAKSDHTAKKSETRDILDTQMHPSLEPKEGKRKQSKRQSQSVEETNDLQNNKTEITLVDQEKQLREKVVPMETINIKSPEESGGKTKKSRSRKTSMQKGTLTKEISTVAADICAQEEKQTVTTSVEKSIVREVLVEETGSKLKKRKHRINSKDVSLSESPPSEFIDLPDVQNEIAFETLEERVKSRRGRSRLSYKEENWTSFPEGRRRSGSSDLSPSKEPVITDIEHKEKSCVKNRKCKSVTKSLETVFSEVAPENQTEILVKDSEMDLTTNIEKSSVKEPVIKDLGHEKIPPKGKTGKSNTFKQEEPASTSVLLSVESPEPQSKRTLENHQEVVMDTFVSKLQEVKGHDVKTSTRTKSDMSRKSRHKEDFVEEDQQHVKEKHNAEEMQRENKGHKSREQVLVEPNSSSGNIDKLVQQSSDPKVVENQEQGDLISKINEILSEEKGDKCEQQNKYNLNRDVNQTDDVFSIFQKSLACNDTQSKAISQDESVQLNNASNNNKSLADTSHSQAAQEKSENKSFPNASKQPIVDSVKNSSCENSSKHTSQIEANTFKADTTEILHNTSEADTLKDIVECQTKDHYKIETNNGIEQKKEDIVPQKSIVSKETEFIQDILKQQEDTSGESVVQDTQNNVKKDKHEDFAALLEVVQEQIESMSQESTHQVEESPQAQDIGLLEPSPKKRGRPKKIKHENATLLNDKGLPSEADLHNTSSSNFPSTFNEEHSASLDSKKSSTHKGKRGRTRHSTEDPVSPIENQNDFKFDFEVPVVEDKKGKSKKLSETSYSETDVEPNTEGNFAKKVRGRQTRNSIEGNESLGNIDKHKQQLIPKVTQEMKVEEVHQVEPTTIFNNSGNQSASFSSQESFMKSVPPKKNKWSRSSTLSMQEVTSKHVSDVVIGKTEQGNSKETVSVIGAAVQDLSSLDTSIVSTEVSKSLSEDSDIILPLKKSKRVNNESITIALDDKKAETSDSFSGSDLLKNNTEGLLNDIKDLDKPEKSVDHPSVETNRQKLEDTQPGLETFHSRDYIKEATDISKCVPPKKKRLELSKQDNVNFPYVSVDQNETTKNEEKHEEIPQPPKKKIQKLFEHSQALEKLEKTNDLPLMSPLAKKKSFLFHNDEFQAKSEKLESVSEIDNTKLVSKGKLKMSTEEVPKINSEEGTSQKISVDEEELPSIPQICNKRKLSSSSDPLCQKEMYVNRSPIEKASSIDGDSALSKYPEDIRQEGSNISTNGNKGSITSDIMQHNSLEQPKELEVKTADDDFKFSIQTNLSNILTSKAEEVSDMTNISKDKSQKISTTLIDKDDSKKIPLPLEIISAIPESISLPEQAELVNIEGNLTVMSEKDLVDAQVEITSEKVISEKKPMTIGSFSMDFGDSSGSVVASTSTIKKPLAATPTGSATRGTEFTTKAMTKEFDNKPLISLPNAYSLKSELLDILEGNSNSSTNSSGSEQKFRISFERYDKTSTVQGMFDFEEAIPSQIVLSNKIQPEQVLADSPKLLEKLSGISSDPRINKSRSQKVVIQSDIKVSDAFPKGVLQKIGKTLIPKPNQKIVIKTTKPSTVTQQTSNKPIIISEQILRPANTQILTKAPTTQQPQGVKRQFEDIEDIEAAFIIPKIAKKAVEEEDRDATPLAQEKPIRSRKITGKAKILQQTIITPKGEIIQPQTPATSSLVSAAVTTAAKSTTSQTIQPAQDDSVFDINSMPIVISDDLLSAESIQNMPVVLSEDVMAGTATICPSKPVEKPGVVVSRKGIAPKQQLIFKTTQPSLSIPSQALASLSKQLNKPRILSTVPPTGSKLSRPTAPALLASGTTADGKPTKYVIVPSGVAAPSSQQVKPVKSTIIKKSSAISQKLSESPSPVVGNKIMIVTNQHGQQHRVVLTPQQQKVLMQGQSQAKVTKTIIKGAIPKALLEAATAGPSGISVKTTFVSSPQGSPMPTISSQGGLLMPVGKGPKLSMQPKKVLQKTPGKQQKTILIKNQLGQTVRKIQGTDDEELDRQVAEQLEAIKASAMLQQANKSPEIINFTNRNIPTKASTARRPVSKKIELSKAKQPSSIPQPLKPQEALVPALAPISPQLKAPSQLSPSSNQNQSQKSINQSQISQKQISIAANNGQASATQSQVSQAQGKLAKKEEDSVDKAIENVVQQHERNVKEGGDKGKPDRPLNQLVIQDALGNLTTVTEGQILALPSETVDGQPQSYMLVTLDETGNLTPLNNEALMSLDPSLGLGGDINNMVLQVDQGQGIVASIKPASPNTTIPINMEVPKVEEQIKPVPKAHVTPEPKVVPKKQQKLDEVPPLVEPQIAVSDGALSQGPVPDPNSQQLIVTGDPIATQKFLESLSDGTTDLANILANAEGGSVIIQADGQQILIKTNTGDAPALMGMTESSEGGGNPIFATHKPNKDILAAALADTDVFQPSDHPSIRPSPVKQLSPSGGGLFPLHSSGVLETSLTMNSPIMTPLEVPSTNAKKIDDEADILSQVPKNVDLPITITDPTISQTVAQQKTASLLELALPISESAASVEINSPSYVYSLPVLEETVNISQKPFNSSMPLLTEDVVEETRSSTETTKNQKLEDDPSDSRYESNLSSLSILSETVTLSQQVEVKSSSFDSVVESMPIFTEDVIDNSELNIESDKHQSFRSSPNQKERDMVDEGLCTLGGEMCSSLSEPPPDMFDFPVSAREEEISSDVSSVPEPEPETLSLNSEGSEEIAFQPPIIASFNDLKRPGDEVDVEIEEKRHKYD